MADITPVELVYDGEEVKDGSVPVDYMIDALVGFSSAYAKIARRTPGAEQEHRIRVVGLKSNSTHILVDIVEFTKAHPLAAGVLLKGGFDFAKGAYRVIKDITGVFKAKKHLEGKPFKDGNVVIKDSVIILLNETGAQLPITKEQLEYLRNALIDPDLDKMTAPLEDERIDKFEMKSGAESLAEASRKERPYFSTARKSITTTRDDVTLEGSLNSLTKDRRKGMFYTVSGKHIPYQFVGPDEQQLLDAFSHPGVVKARGKVSFDGNLEPIHMQIVAIFPEQPRIM